MAKVVSLSRYRRKRKRDEFEAELEQLLDEAQDPDAECLKGLPALVAILLMAAAHEHGRRKEGPAKAYVRKLCDCEDEHCIAHERGDE